MEVKRIIYCKSKFDNSIFESKGMVYSFLNLASLGKFFSRNSISQTHYFMDGMLMAMIVNFFYNKNVQRISFDFTSIADNFFTYVKNNNKSAYFIGGTEQENSLFVDKMKNLYPGVLIVGSRGGYFDCPSAIDNEIESIIKLSPDYVVAGLGAGFQEDFLEKLASKGFKGTSFSCGGFIRQEATATGFYYPPLINKLALRAFYRMYKEPHTIIRYLIDYPKSIIKIVFLILTKKINVVFV